MSATPYNLSWAYQTTDFFRKNNLFFHNDAAKQWLESSRKVAGLINRLRAAAFEATRDADNLDNHITNQTFPVRDLIRDLIVFGAAAKGGYITRVPVSMSPGGEFHRYQGRSTRAPRARRDIPDEVIKISFKNEEAIELWSEWYKGLIADASKKAIKDMSLLWVMKAGIDRRREKLNHNYNALLKEFYDRMYVSFGVIRHYIQSLVQRGQWSEVTPHQSLFNEIVQVFVGALPWSAQSKAASDQVAEMRSFFKYVGDEKTSKGLLLIVDLAIRSAGGIAA